MEPFQSDTLYRKGKTVRHKKCNGGKLPSPDKLGRWRPEVGQDARGRRVRFQVGTRGQSSEHDAQKRLEAIRDFYQRQCQEHGIDFWGEGSLHFAKRMSQSIPVIFDQSSYAKRMDGFSSEELIQARKLQSWGLPIVITDNLYAKGTTEIREHIDDAIQRAVNQAIEQFKKSHGVELIEEIEQNAPPLEQRETKSLYDAIKQYQKHLEATGKRDEKNILTAHIGKCIEQLEAMKEHHADLRIWQLDLSAIEKIISYWKQRPETKRGGRCSIEHSRKMIKIFGRLLRYIEANYKWTIPKGVNSISKKPIDLKSDEYTTAFNSNTTPTYTPEQLGIIAEHTDQFGKMMISLCVNCSFGAGEVGQWQTKNIHLNSAHPHADVLGIVSTDADSWIVGIRGKNGVYGEHLLWEEVARAVKPFLDDGREVLPITNKETPWYRPHSKNAQSSFQNWWGRILDKVIEELPDFPRLPFGSLRDTLPNILRREYSGELASLCLQHGKIGNDDLLNCYANLPFGKLFTATRQLRPMFAPLLKTLCPVRSSPIL